MSEINQWPCFSQIEADAVSKVLLSNKVNYWTGEEGKKFEKEFSEWCGTKYAVALSNGTVALEIALRALGVGPGDEVVVTPRSFIASVSSVINVGAKPIFADVDLNSGNISPSSISDSVSNKTKAIICVHLSGFPCEMDEILDIAVKYDLFVIEDCAQSHGAMYKNKRVGSIGHIGCWSFCQDKIMTTGGEGGMISTNHESLWQKIWAFKDHGKNFKSVHEVKHSPGYRWLHDSFGSNFRMTEMQSAIGRIQLTKVDEWNRIRAKNARTLIESLRKFDSLITIPKLNEYSIHAWYKFNIYLKKRGLARGWDRDRIIKEINLHGIPCFTGPCPEIYLEKAFKGSLRPKKRLINAKVLGESTLMFLVHPTLTDNDISKMCKVIDHVLCRASKKIYD